MYGFKIIIEGEYACFTRPEMKTERVSYDVPTPSALEGLLKSVYWKPAIRYCIDKIIVFNPIEFTSFKRNEVKEKISFGTVKKRMSDPTEDVSIDTGRVRSQRTSTILKNVRYGVEFHFELTGLKSEDEGSDAEKKHFDIIRRRLEKGQHFRVPCLGCAEYPVKKIELVSDFNLSEIHESIAENEDVDLGYMLYRLNYEDKGKPINGDWNNPVFSDNATATYYRPHMCNGIIDVEKARR